MKMRIIQSALITLSMLPFQACVGPATQALHHRSLRLDPPPAQYHGVWQTDSAVYISYSPKAPAKPWQDVRSTQYWARVALSEVDGLHFKGWEIERKHRPKELDGSDARAIPMVDISTNRAPEGSHFLNRDQYLTYIVDSEHIPLPALLLDPTNYNTFHLISPTMLHGSYRGIWNPPQGSYRDYSTVAKNSWKYPFCMLADIVLYPLNKWLEHALRNWT
jgi:hypothetical protein